MAKILLKKDHIIFSSAQDISEICKPLLKLGITSFNYVRTYDDGSQINLANIPEWLEHFYKNNFHKIGEFEKHPSNYISGYALWSYLSKQHIFYDARHYFNIDNGITILEKQFDCCDFFYFGSMQGNHEIINFYLNNLDLLKRFILYFKDKGNKIINEANKNRVILPDHFECSEDKNIHSTEILNIRKDFLQQITVNNFILSGELEGEKLTKKQFNCLIHLLEGKTAKEIGKLLGISFRTVEEHIQKMKVKFNCPTKTMLIYKMLNSGLGIYSSKCNIIF